MLIESLATGVVKQKLEPFMITLDSGAGTTFETYTHEGGEFVHYLAGTIEYRVGDSLLFKATLGHSFKNPTGSQSAALIVLEEHVPDEGQPSVSFHKTMH